MSIDNWQHRSTGMICASCMWFVAKGDPAVGLGRCRRNSPKLDGFPAVFHNDWCGDHKLDEEKLEPDDPNPPEDAVSEVSDLSYGFDLAPEDPDEEEEMDEDEEDEE